KKAGKKKAGKKKAGKKKAGKKKAGKKKAGKKKAGKKKSKKKRGKKRGKKAAVKTGSPWDKLAEAAEQLREAAQELAAKEAREGSRALRSFADEARSKLSDLETAAQRGIQRLTGR
ncbi:MAG: hypothetical protein R3323_08060, partial [Wenzhouxiangellaceae bacterium]|nr:hypothetical protein [Wenzhouxiangellaceae bacterium]